MPWHEVVSETPALRERELAKMGALSEALGKALQERGVAEFPAVLAAWTGMVTFSQATLAWLDDPEPSLGERLELAFHELRTLVLDTT